MSEFDDIDGDFEDDFEEELEMFVEAQDTVWSDVLAELTAGKKTGHWMWSSFRNWQSLASRIWRNSMASKISPRPRPILAIASCGPDW